jgi:2-polyprenyl-3-methyl-5-hydroxy-6-metoxy-1,4-benzoquinol methylase
LKEPILEPVLRKMRIRQVLPTIQQYPNCKVLDVGCGWDYRLLKTIEPYISSGTGIDFKVPEINKGKIATRQIKLDARLPFNDDSFDVVTMLAVLEHLSNPLGIVKEIERILSRNGRLVLTVPSKLSKPVLEFLSYRLKIVNEDEIRDHKKYYDYRELQNLSAQTNLTIEQHKYFQMGMNNFCVMLKTKTN